MIVAVLVTSIPILAVMIPIFVLFPIIVRAISAVPDVSTVLSIGADEVHAIIIVARMIPSVAVVPLQKASAI